MMLRTFMPKLFPRSDLFKLFLPCSRVKATLTKKQTGWSYMPIFKIRFVEEAFTILRCSKPTTINNKKIFWIL